jgi:predicted RNA polymerase sigma factor
MTVARRRLVDQWRSESARRRREETFTLESSTLQPAGTAPNAWAFNDEAAPDADDTLPLLYLCSDPALSQPSQLALNRAVAIAMLKGPLAGLAVLGTVEKIRNWPPLTALMQCGRTCSNSLVTGRPPGRPTSWLQAPRQAFPSAATSPHGPRG